MCWHARFPRLTLGSVTFWAFRRADVGTFSKKTTMSTQTWLHRWQMGILGEGVTGAAGVWSGKVNTQHVTSEPHIVRPWGRPDLMGIRRAPLLFIQHHPLQTPHFHPHPRLPSPTGCINSASLAPTFTSPERPLCEPKGMLDKKRDCAFYRAQHGESNRKRPINLGNVTK